MREGKEVNKEGTAGESPKIRFKKLRNSAHAEQKKDMPGQEPAAKVAKSSATTPKPRAKVQQRDTKRKREEASEKGPELKRLKKKPLAQESRPVKSKASVSATAEKPNLKNKNNQATNLAQAGSKKRKHAQINSKSNKQTNANGSQRREISNNRDAEDQVLNEDAIIKLADHCELLANACLRLEELEKLTESEVSGKLTGQQTKRLKTLRQPLDDSDKGIVTQNNNELAKLAKLEKLGRLTEEQSDRLDALRKKPINDLAKYIITQASTLDSSLLKQNYKKEFNDGEVITFYHQTLIPLAALHSNYSLRFDLTLPYAQAKAYISQGKGLYRIIADVYLERTKKNLNPPEWLRGDDLKEYNMQARDAWFYSNNMQYDIACLDLEEAYRVFKETGKYNKAAYANYMKSHTAFEKIIAKLKEEIFPQQKPLEQKIEKASGEWQSMVEKIENTEEDADVEGVDKVKKYKKHALGLEKELDKLQKESKEQYDYNLDDLAQHMKKYQEIAENYLTENDQEDKPDAPEDEDKEDKSPAPPVRRKRLRRTRPEQTGGNETVANSNGVRLSQKSLFTPQAEPKQPEQREPSQKFALGLFFKEVVSQPVAGKAQSTLPSMELAAPTNNSHYSVVDDGLGFCLAPDDYINPQANYSFD